MASPPTEYSARVHGAEQAADALLAFAEGFAALAERPGEEGRALAEAHFARGRSIAEALNARPLPPGGGAHLEVVINVHGGCLCGDPRALGESLRRVFDDPGGGAKIDAARVRSY